MVAEIFNFLDLDKVYGWAEENGMNLNAGKFELLRFWLDRESAPDILYMAPDGGPIEEKDCLRDLGVSNNFTFSTQRWWRQVAA